MIHIIYTHILIPHSNIFPLPCDSYRVTAYICWFLGCRRCNIQAPYSKLLAELCANLVAIEGVCVCVRVCVRERERVCVCMRVIVRPIITVLFWITTQPDLDQQQES